MIESHYLDVIDAMASGTVVPFLGAGANLCGRQDGVDFVAGDGTALPSGGELSDYLARKFRYPATDSGDLARVTQYIVVQRGSLPLYTELHRIFSPSYAPSPLHRFLAGLPKVLREKGSPSPYQLIITTNYDDALETAFGDAGEEFELVRYIAEGAEDRKGKFVHDRADGEQTLIDLPNEYVDLVPDKRTVILKLHGDVEKAHLDAQQDSYVITEDDYIQYLTHSTNPANLIPIGLLNTMRSSSFLFLGYSLRDWNLRVILYRLWKEQPLQSTSWAIQKNPQEFERKFWATRSVDLLDIDLDDYVANLSTHAESYELP